MSDQWQEHADEMLTWFKQLFRRGVWWSGLLTHCPSCDKDDIEEGSYIIDRVDEFIMHSYGGEWIEVTMIGEFLCSRCGEIITKLPRESIHEVSLTPPAVDSESA